ncbi:MAG: EAL domain-containing protein [Cyanobacteria bacterium P01_F01_bin.42]
MGERRYVNLLECIVEVTHGLFTPAELEKSLNQILAQIGGITGVDGIYYLGMSMIAPPPGRLAQKFFSTPDFFTWTRHSSEVTQSPGAWLKEALKNSDTHPVWQALLQGRSLEGTPDSMPADIALCLHEQSIHSILLMPTLWQQQVIGVLGIENRRSNQDWTGPELLALQQLNRILGVALKQFYMESHLAHYAFHDPLTELPNRALLLNRLEQCIKRKARHKDYSFAVLFLDLDRFKPINDRLGHKVGDHLLVQVAQRLSACIRPGDTVARMGGDEFVILLDEIFDVPEAEIVIQRIRSELTRRFQIAGHDLHIDASIGIALSSADLQSGEAILQKADLAMYRAKNAGKGCYRFFESSMHSQMIQKSETESEMHLALQNEEFDVHYQPIVELETGLVKGFEALARWNHPLMGLLEPGYFIPIAEETGMIKTLGMQVLRAACFQAQSWQISNKEHPAPTVNVNLSAKQFGQKNLVHNIKKILSETQLSPEKLHLELTESCIFRKDGETLGLIHQLRDLGIQIYLDDFGAGYSSLQYLNFFPLSGLKIDRTFTQKLHVSQGTQAIVRSVIVMAQALSMDIVVEGIENQQQIDYLKNFCGVSGQGFLFARPLAAKQAQSFLASQQHMG